MAHSAPIDESPEEIRTLLAPMRNRVSVALYAFGNAFAVGAIIRVAHSFLVREIILVGDEPHYEKASMGMEKYETIVRIDDDDALVRHVGARPLWAIEKDHASTSLYGAPAFPDDVVLLFGSERGGLPDSVLARAERVIGIPMYGVNHSFPVAIACGMVLGEWSRRRYRDGTIA
jgi:tRNA G18 (ribose-2'-O)-methylase SpoU